MATSARDRRRRRPRVAAAALLVLLSCIHPEAPVESAPAPAVEQRTDAEPTIRVGLAVGAATVLVGGGGAIAVSGADGAPLATVPPAAEWRAVPVPGGVSLAGPAGIGSGVTSALTLRPVDSAEVLRINGRAYRGVVTLLRDRTGVTIVDQLPLETYLASVVSSEMGRRDSADVEALRAQAIVSRTYALRNMGRWRADGFDLYGTVADQVYGGVGNETPLGTAAVIATRGRVLTYAGALVDAFFFSTCGGRTADGVESFRAADRPYLRSVQDTGPDGGAWCSLSPRFRWREEWTGEQVRTALRRSLPAARLAQAADVATVRDVRVGERSRSGRVARLDIALGGSDVRVDGPHVRQVLRTAQGEPLRSNAFTLSATGGGHRITRLVADGGGAGHGVGFCQWGAVGRARAGQSAADILAAYYGGTQLQQAY